MHFLSDFFQILKDVEFANPYYFLFLLLLIPLVGWPLWKRHKMHGTLQVSTTESVAKAPRTWKQRFFFLPLVCRALAVIFIVIALARPQSAFRQQNIQVEGVDIVLTVDVSGSMKCMDFRPNRLAACKKVAAEFIEGRPTDRIGLVVYAGEAFTQCPATTDHQTLLGLLEKVKFDLIEDGTAIGDGLGTAINRLRETNAKSKIIILLSDGVNNSGYMDPLSAAEIAKDYNIKVYTIGCGSMGQAPYPGPYGTVYVDTEIDENLLKSIAATTGGKYFRATNTQKLEEVYKEIDKMEKTIINETTFENKADEFIPFLVFALIFIGLEILLRFVIYKNW
ncbi:MAG: VWA domain-containing protein [Bacteroidales bacterium]|nr:VWA domain-containing protein [Bacteroidales bacterium]